MDIVAPAAAAAAAFIVIYYSPCRRSKKGQVDDPKRMR